jgi:cation diffusion facilitator CzcD-associated flavoprotein CzcO
VEIENDHVILLADEHDFDKLERTKIPDHLEIEAKPVVAIIGAGAGKLWGANEFPLNGSFQRASPALICSDRMDSVAASFSSHARDHCRTIEWVASASLWWVTCDPFQVQLSKQPNKKPQDLLLRDHSYLKNAHIDLMLDTDVATVHWTGKNLTYKTMGNQLKSLQYDYLVLATGLQSRRLPPSLLGHDLRNIFYLRSLEDAGQLVSKRLLRRIGSMNADEST